MTAEQLLLMIAVAVTAFVAGWVLRYRDEPPAAGRDALTGLADRGHFDQQMDQRVAEFHRYGRAFALLLLDVDQFKEINDTYGHPAGDAVLRKLATILDSAVRQSDIVARYGGEEFAVFLPGTPLPGARQMGDRLRGAVAAEVIPAGETELQITVSVGVAEIATDETAAMLLERADRALYAAKRAGRNAVRGHNGSDVT